MAHLISRGSEGQAGHRDDESRVRIQSLDLGLLTKQSTKRLIQVSNLFLDSLGVRMVPS